MDELVLKYHKTNNYASAEKIYKYMKRDGLDIKIKDIKNILNNQEAYQMMKKPVNKSSGHIIAHYPNEFMNLDIFDLSKFNKYNKGFKYILCLIDIFTRKAYCKAMKSKNSDDVLKEFENIIIDNEIMPTVLVTDSDSSFLSDKFIKYLNKYDINLNTVPVGDHHSLGVIDRFALTLKTIISRMREFSGSSNWVDEIDDIIKKYNNTEHKGLLGLSPNEAGEKINFELIYNYNMKKGKVNNIISDLTKGDKVRIDLRKTFNKGSEARFSKEIYEVDHVSGKTVYLTNGDKKKRDMLLKISKDTKINIKEDTTRKVIKENKIKRLIKKVV